ncbi:hypothetical protein HHA03_12650 [Halolactibacillus halophilus]|uniref:Uncharacterized protein n=1 Tax=Halolactibacillus halophilus TaxID=306540 RepID=A0ABQ0VKS9_9BACI|nr:hypothetical protein HHA03_12650 [Halolactibacillus halophilus]
MYDASDDLFLSLKFFTMMDIIENLHQEVNSDAVFKKFDGTSYVKNRLSRLRHCLCLSVA